MKKKISILTLLFCFIITTCSLAYYEKIDKQTITSGAVLNNITRFSSDGWTYINMLEVDMTNDNIKLDVIYSENGITSLTNIKNMAKTSNVVAGINADYFAKRNDMTNRGQAIGFTASNGQILTSGSDENHNKDEFATYILNEDNEIIYTYLKDTITLISPSNGESIYVADINKFLPLEAPCCIFTPAMVTSIGNSKGDHVIELVVENNKVVEIRENKEGTKIPENGYVVSAYGDKYGKFLLDNFKVGSKIEYKVDIGIDIDKIKTAVSGGSILVNNGIVSSKLSHTIYGKHEFTVIGSSQDNSKSYLLTITRKDGSSTEGITQTELANICSELGMYNALCLDGGGSTTMVARQEGSQSITSINIKDGSYLRPVINGIGIYSTNETGKLKSINFKLDNENIFENNATGFKVMGYDENSNPIEINTKDIKITFNNNNAKYNNGKIVGLKEGKTLVTVEYKKVKASANINILGDIYRLEISPRRANVAAGKTQFFTLVGYDRNGKSAKVDNSLVKWSVNGTGSVSNKGLYTAKEKGITFVCASIDNVKTYAKLAVDGATSYSYMLDDVYRQDELNYTNENAKFKIGIIEEIYTPSTLFDSIKNNRVINELNNSDLVVLNKGSNDSNLLKQFRTTYIQNTGYTKKDIENCTIITINSNTSIRKTDYNQWEKLFKDITNTKQNVFIVLNSNLDDFVDVNEKQLFLDTLSKQKEKTGYNYFIINKGNTNECITYNGIKVLTIGNSAISKTDINDNLDNYSYIQIYVDGNEVSYDIKNIF